MTSRFCLLLLMLVATNALAEQYKLAKWELGVSLLALSTPDYRGSAESSSYLLPVPHIRYRGEVLRLVDGIETRLFKSDNLLLSISGEIALPADNNSAERIGMEELEGNWELGPSLEYRIRRSERSSLWFELPLRIGFTFENSPQNIGLILHPRLGWRIPAKNKNEWRFGFSGGPLFASKRNHDYYYTVSAAEALPSRPEYRAESGYSGIRADFGFSKRFGIYRLGGFVRYDSINGSVVENSPLVSQTSNWTAGIAIGWIFFEKYPD